jgi:hypothetical protein
MAGNLSTIIRRTGCNKSTHKPNNPQKDLTVLVEPERKKDVGGNFKRANENKFETSWVIIICEPHRLERASEKPLRYT